MARASIIGVMPSVQLMPRSSNTRIMFRSMKSTPSGLSATPASSMSAMRALVNFATCELAAGPAAPLIQAYE